MHRHRSAGNARVARRARRRARRRRARPRAFPDRAADRQGAPLGRVPAVLARTPRTSTRFPSTGRRRFPATRTSSTASARTCAGTRWRWCVRANKDTQRRRPHRELRVGGDALRRRLQPLLARAVRRARRRPRVRPGPLVDRASTRARSCSAASTEEQLDNFRQEVDGKGISSYPHPWLMPDFWQFPTVSMGLGPLMAIYQARFMKYLQDRGLAKTEGRKVWCFCGDGEMDEPESMGAIGMASRENARQPDLRRQLQPAAPRRPGARQRQDHPGARERLPRRRLERDQGDLGHRTGTRCSRATRRAS